MTQNSPIPIIDVFAGPGGLGEGFSSLRDDENNRVFDIRLSIEKDPDAHKTLELRSFFRQFPHGEVPDEYYEVMKQTNQKDRELKKAELYKSYPSEHKKAQKEAWLAELGSDEFPSELIDQRIKTALGKKKNWVLIGGPPCQAYSLVGRSRVGGISDEDHRVYLYKEYLRIIAVHHPAVFVMENVKGLLSANVNGEKVFDWILNDLRNPAQSVEGATDAPEYKIYSLVKKPNNKDLFGQVQYKEDNDYLIKAEKYGIPQKRHRVILLGVRQDIDTEPDVLKEADEQVTVKDVISDLPEIRSGLNRKFTGYLETVNDEGVKKLKRSYKNLIDSEDSWSELISGFKQQMISWNGFANDIESTSTKAPEYSIGQEYIECDTPSDNNPLKEWYQDKKLEGISNHESRSHLLQDLKRYLFSSLFTQVNGRFPRLHEFANHSKDLMPEHENAASGKFVDRFRVQLPDQPATTITSHISKDGHYFIHYDPNQCRSFTVREAARIQTFPDNYLFCGSRTAQFHQVGNAVPPLLANKTAGIVEKLLMKITSP